MRLTTRPNWFELSESKQGTGFEAPTFFRHPKSTGFEAQRHGFRDAVPRVSRHRGTGLETQRHGFRGTWGGFRGTQDTGFEAYETRVLRHTSPRENSHFPFIFKHLQ